MFCRRSQGGPGNPGQSIRKLKELGGRVEATPIKIGIIAIVVALHALTFHAISMHLDEYFFDSDGFTKFSDTAYDDGQQYAYYADSILHGTEWLELEVPDWLAQMENPYDADERFALASETGEPYYWDYAFYDGHYYCYFGILPALVAFVPFKLITGADLRTDWAVSFFAAFLAIVMAVFLFKFMRRYFPSTSFGVYILSFMLFAMASGILTQVFYPLFYSLPPLAGLSCLFLGLTFWVCSRREGGSLRPGMLAAGSLFMALTLACRPQLFLGMFVAVPLFWDEITRDRLFFSRKGMGNTAAMLLPCLIVAGLVMYHNWVRFDSPFDFGAAYNLTGFDMTQNSGFSFQTAWVSLLFYILMPLDLKASFPFLDQIEWRSTVPVEPYLGGFFVFAPACLAILGLWHFRNELRGKRLLAMCGVCCVFAVILMVISAQVASISMRYFSDFCWAVLIPALCVWLASFEKNTGSRAYVWVAVVFAVLVLGGELLNYWSLLSPARYGSFASFNPEFYESIAALFGA